VHEVPLPEGGVVVDEAKVRLLAYLSRIVEAHFTTIFQKATPQDMEWLIKDGKVYVVQSRPYLTGK
jgi:phosphoenolpyruvate synthase/pyruvate phosphate dikinase